LNCPPTTHSQTTAPPTKCPLCAALFKQDGPQAKVQRCQEPYPPSFRCVFGIPANEPPREGHILTLTIRAHRCQKPHTLTNHSPIRPKTPPTKFPMCFAFFKQHGPQAKVQRYREDHPPSCRSILDLLKQLGAPHMPRARPSILCFVLRLTKTKNVTAINSASSS
jgi:hypothetical protein